MAAEFFKKVTHKAIDFAKYLSMTFPFFVRDGIFAICNMRYHGLWTPNEGINQRYLKNWADMADKIYFGYT